MGIQQIFLGAVISGDAGYQVEKSLRFNPDDSAFLDWTPSSAGNRRTWTYSNWVKRTNPGTTQFFFSGGPDGSNDTDQITVFFESDDQLRINSGNSVFLETTQVFRDPSAFYHIVVAVDTGNSTANDRIKLYVNGSQVEDFDTRNNPGENDNTGINAAVEHRLGKATGSSYSGDANSFNGYLADVHMVDGLELTPGDFAEEDETTGQWVPKEYTHVASPNDGTTWSDALSLTGGSSWNSDPYGKDACFNGIVGTGSGGYGQSQGGTNPNSITFTPPSSIAYTSSIEVYVTNPANEVSVNGGTLQSINDDVWVEVASGSGTLTSLKFERASTNGASFCGIKIDGKVLLDDAGDNSFHLKFDPTATPINDGTTWSNETSGGTVHGSYPMSQSFNGSTGDVGARATAGGFVFGGSLGIPYSSSIRVHSGGTYGTQQFKLNDGTATDMAENTWVTVVSGSGTLNKLEITAGSTGNSNIYLAAVEVDGNILVDDADATLGVDSSGNINEWTANNLLATSPNDGTTWSDAVPTGDGFRSGRAAADGFDGDFNTYVAIDNTTFNLDVGSWGITGTLEVYTGSTHEYAVDGGSASSMNANNWTNVGDAGSITTLTLTRTNSAYPYFYAIRVGGTILIDDQNDAPEIDLLADSPSTYNDGGNGVGNYATLSPLVAQTSGGHTLSNGNLTVTCDGTRTTSMSNWALTGKTYWEATVTASSSTSYLIGMTRSDGFNTVANNNSGIKYVGYKDYSWGWNGYTGDLVNASNIEASPGTFANDGSDVVGWAFDADNLTIKCYKNGSLEHTETGIASGTYFPAITLTSTNGYADLNFGQRAFAYTPPTGYKALNTFNLDDPTIDDPSAHFDVGLDAGADILTTATGLTDGADFVWIKDRDNSDDHILFNRINDTGMDGTPHLRCNEGDSESTCGTYSAPSGNSVAWVWNAGSSTVSNTDGTITSSVRANTTAGFSIVSYTGEGTSGDSIGHGLNAAPSFVLIKNRDQGDGWAAMHTGAGLSGDNIVNTSVAEYYMLYLNESNARANWTGDVVAPNGSSLLTLGSGGMVNTDTEDYIAYCWSEVPGYSKFGSYSGQSFVYTGFRPKYVLIKSATSSAEWHTHTTSPIDNDNPVNLYTRTNSDGAEGLDSDLDILSNGFYPRATGSWITDTTMIYIAFAESPFKYSNAR